MRLDLLNIIQEIKETPGDNLIIGRLGKTGSGKTADQNEENVLPILLDGQEVRCCYWLNWDTDKFPNLQYFAPRDFEKIKDERNCTIVFDEIRRSFDPRGWELESEELRSFVELHRHRHNDIIFNTQDVSLVAKTFGIQTHEWSLMEKISPGMVIQILDKIREKESIRMSKTYMSFQQLKKLANGWELGEDVALEAESVRIKYSIERLIHHELDDYKVELIHRYCKRCKSRQGEQIKKVDTEKEAEWIEGEWISKREIFCPKHKKEILTIRESGMFDTDYEPETTKENFRVVKYRMCKACGKEHVIN